MEPEKEQKRNFFQFFVKEFFAPKNDRKGSSSTRLDPQEHKRVKNADFKIWSFFTKNRGLTPREKVDFWTKNKYSFKSFQSNQYVRKCLLRHVLGLPMDEGQRNSLGNVEHEYREKRKFFYIDACSH